MNKIYGISNCDTVKKAKNWLTETDIPFEFIDFRKEGLSSEKVSKWARSVGMDRLLNRRGTTWRNLNESQKALTDNTALVELLTENPTLIKRPVLETQDRIEVGFKPDLYQALFNQQSK